MGKDEKIDLQYLFRSELTQRELPSGVHKGSVTITKGMSSDDVCRLVREDGSRLGDKFKLLEVAGVKEDRDHLLVCCAGGRTIGSFIAPVSITFVELGALKWVEGTALFDDFKDGVVVTERRWYEQMKHTFPYSQWTVLDLYATYSQKAFVANRDTGSGVAQPMSVRIRDGGQGMKSSKK